MYLFADYHPSQCSTDFFLFVLVIILMLSRGVIVTAANYHSSPLKAESNGHITPLPLLPPFKSQSNFTFENKYIA